MILLAYLFLGCLIFTGLFLFTAIIVEKYIPQNSKFMKWWRKHVMAPAPQDLDI